MRVRQPTILAVVLLLGVTVGMIGLGYHYLIDVVGGTFFAVFAVVAARGLTRPGPRAEPCEHQHGRRRRIAR